jgi:hypothetical protein
MSLSRVAIIASFCLGLSGAAAQQPQQTATTSCSPRGTPTCPTFTAPAATAVQHASMDGSMNIAPFTSTTLFNGATPPNGFMVQVASGIGCAINDNGSANGFSAVKGFLTVGPDLFVTPPGYRPIGPVNIFCGGSASTYVNARGW